MQALLEVLLPYEPLCPSVGWLVFWSVDWLIRRRAVCHFLHLIGSFTSMLLTEHLYLYYILYYFDNTPSILMSFHNSIAYDSHLQATRLLKSSFACKVCVSILSWHSLPYLMKKCFLEGICCQLEALKLYKIVNNNKIVNKICKINDPIIRSITPLWLIMSVCYFNTLSCFCRNTFYI